uniref:IQ calmodulin-binding motif-containing protein 1 n=2 Tax=Arion vulgaris TaxID=1028688 RepID=A0A0B6ZDD5_9EUPU
MDTTLAISPRKGDQRVIQLAKEISESKDRKVPSLLMALRPILNDLPAGTDKGTQIRNEIWQYNLLKVLVLVMRQDFSVVAGEWETAAELAALLSNATCGLKLTKDDQRQLEEDHLPKSTENLLLLARHIHGIINSVQVSKETERERDNLITNLQVVMDSLVRLCSGYFYICSKVISSPWLLQLLVSDTAKVAKITMAIMDKILRLDPHLLSKSEESTVNTLLDELVYKLTVNTDVSVAAEACRCLIRFCDHHKPLVEALCSRYKGLRPLLRRWEGQGFDRNLRLVTMMLESGSAKKAKSQRNYECARYIQAIWRGFSARKRLRNANKAFAKFQKSYRLKRAEEEQVKLQTQYQSELYYQMKRKRQQLMRRFNEKRLHTLEILPASRVEDYLKKEKSVAATRIQTLWRGHRERTKLTDRQSVAQQVRAAIKIQRAFRKWLEKSELARQKFPTHLKPTGLTDDRRVELSKQISNWRELNPTRQESIEELEVSLKRAQGLLSRHYSSVRPYRKLQYQVENLLARLDTDMELVALAPSLKEITEDDVQMYSSRSLPVATAAKHQHNQMMKKLQQPWWKSLGMDDLEVDEDEKERVEAEILLQTMGL